MVNGCFLNTFYQFHVFRWGRGLFRSSHLHSRTLWMQHLNIIIKIVGHSGAPESVLRTAMKSQETVCAPAQTSPVGTDASRGRVCCLLISPQHTSDIQDFIIYQISGWHVEMQAQRSGERAVFRGDVRVTFRARPAALGGARTHGHPRRD